MADGVNITSGSGVVIASDEGAGGEQHQYVKLEFGADGTQTVVTNAAPMPISGTTIAITSLPALGAGSVSSISGMTSAQVSITGLVLVSGTTITITSLPHWVLQ
jgi:hypothetical protein